MKLSNQNIYNLRGCKNFLGRCQMPLGGGGGQIIDPPRKSVPVRYMYLFLFQLSVKNCFIRGSVVRYVQLPAEEVDTQLLQDATRKEATQTKT
jgi:hypothetical protein